MREASQAGQMVEARPCSVQSCKRREVWHTGSCCPAASAAAPSSAGAPTRQATSPAMPPIQPAAPCLPPTCAIRAAAMLLACSSRLRAEPRGSLPPPPLPPSVPPLPLSPPPPPPPSALRTRPPLALAPRACALCRHSAAINGTVGKHCLNQWAVVQGASQLVPVATRPTAPEPLAAANHQASPLPLATAQQAVPIPLVHSHRNRQVAAVPSQAPSLAPGPAPVLRSSLVPSRFPPDEPPGLPAYLRLPLHLRLQVLDDALHAEAGEVKRGV